MCPTECDKLMHDGTGSGRLTPGADLSFVAAKEPDVVLDPLEGGALVVETGIRQAFLFHGIASEKTVGTDLGVSVIVECTLIANAKPERLLEYHEESLTCRGEWSSGSVRCNRSMNRRREDAPTR